jgi:hypothetical protein
MFIKPKELNALMQQNGFNGMAYSGMSPNVSPLKMISLLRQRAKGKLTYQELGNLLWLQESKDTKVGYMGYGIMKS